MMSIALVKGSPVAAGDGVTIRTIVDESRAICLHMDVACLDV